MKKWLLEAAAVLQAKFPPAKVVTLLTPLVFVPVAIFLAAWVPKHFPGMPRFSSAQLVPLMAAGALAALTAGYQRVRGWREHEHTTRVLIDEEAKRDHEKHLALLGAESAERIALVEKADNLDRAEEVLGISPTEERVAAGSPAAAIVTPPPPPPAPVAAPVDPIPAPAPQEPEIAAQPSEPPAPDTPAGGPVMPPVPGEPAVPPLS